MTQLTHGDNLYIDSVAVRIAIVSTHFFPPIQTKKKYDSHSVDIHECKQIESDNFTERFFTWNESVSLPDTSKVVKYSLYYEII